jgi:multidrug efflux system membrane fusion protein
LDSVDSCEAFRDRTGASRAHRLRRAAICAVAAGVLSAGISLVGCSSGRSKPAGRVPVVVAVVEQRPMPYQIDATGTVEPRETASVGSEVGGWITRLGFHEGSDVQQGQLLFQLDSKPYQAALDQARAILHRDIALADNARAKLERTQKMRDQSLVSPEEYEGDLAASRSVEAQVRSDSAAVENARLTLEYAAIRAPISGRAGRLLVHVGDYVKSGTTDPLVTINQLHPILVRFAVPERELHEIQRFRNRQLEVEVAPSTLDSVRVVGRLTFVDNAVDPTTGTILLKAEFPNRDGMLWPGEFVEVHLVLYVEPHATVVPEAAVTTTQSGTFVYVVGADSTVASRPVTVSRTQGQLAIIESGVQPGEQVVTDGQLRLGPGARVEITRPVATTVPSEP